MKKLYTIQNLCDQLKYDFELSYSGKYGGTDIVIWELEPAEQIFEISSSNNNIETDLEKTIKFLKGELKK